MRKVLVRKRERIESLPEQDRGVYIEFQAHLGSQGEHGHNFVGHFVAYPFDSRDAEERAAPYKRLDVQLGRPSLEELGVWVTDMATAIPVTLRIRESEQIVQGFCESIVGMLSLVEAALEERQAQADAALLQGMRERSSRRGEPTEPIPAKIPA